MTVIDKTETLLPDFSDPATFVDGVPHGAFDIVRELPGLYWQPTQFGTYRGGFWLASRFADIVEVEKSTESVTSNLGFFYPVAGSLMKMTPQDLIEARHNIMRSDPPEHSRMRRAAAASFAPRVVARFDDWIRAVVNEVLDDCLILTEFDWVEHAAKLIPSRVVAAVLGVPAERREDIVKWTDAMFHAATSPEGAVRMRAIAEEMYIYIRELDEFKRAEPGDDMATLLGQSVDRGDITFDEYLNYIMLLMVAGYETTHTLIGQSMRLYLEDPQVAATTDAFVAEGKSAPLIDEFLRFITPAMNMARVATRDFEVAGTQIKENDVIQLMFISGNRDSDVFQNPHSFHPDRSETATLAFGSGPHRCIGNALAKLEGRILFEELARRDVQLKLAGVPKRGWSTWINQLFELPVRVVAR